MRIGVAHVGRQCRKPYAYYRDLEDIAAGDLLLLLGLRELLIDLGSGGHGEFLLGRC